MIQDLYAESTVVPLALFESSAIPLDTGSSLDEMITLIVAVRTELALFCVAFALHQLFFGKAFPGAAKFWRPSKKASTEGQPTFPNANRRNPRAPPGLEEPAGRGPSSSSEQALHWKQQAGDHSGVLRLWTSLRRSGEVSIESLGQVVESMQRLKKDSSSTLAEIQGYFCRTKDACHTGTANQLLEMITKSLDVDLVNGVLTLMASLDMKSNSFTYELLIQMHFSMRNLKEVSQLYFEMGAEQLAPTTRTSLILLKVAIQAGNLDGAVKHFKELSHESLVSTASQAPQHIAAQIVELACREQRLDFVLAEVHAAGIPLTAEMANSMLSESVRLNDCSIAERVKSLVANQKLQLNSRSYQHLIRGAGDDQQAMSGLISEMAEKGVECLQEVVTYVLSVCMRSGTDALANQLFELVKIQQPCNVVLLSAFARYYAEAGLPDRACTVYDGHLKAHGQSANDRRRLDSRTEKLLVSAAMQCGRKDIAADLVGCSSNDTAKHINMIRNCASKGDLAGAMNIFESLEAAGADLTHSVFNSLLDACVECRDMNQAELLMKRMVADGMVDACSYNTMIKAHLQDWDYQKARGVMDTMRQAGCMPNPVTYNELINALVRSDQDAHRAQVWEVIDEMKLNDVRPNKITCSILLRCLKARSPPADVARVMELTDRMEEPMDEVLLSSIIEACVRVGKPGLLTAKLEQLQGKNAITVTGAHTFGSLIKAYGAAHDMDGAWRCWKAMRTQHIKPTSITIGCMVEAVASNGDADGAYELISQLLEDPRCKSQINSVVFGSVLKAYGRTKRMDQVWTVFSEMTSQGIAPSGATFNTLIDACVRNNQLEAIEGLLKDMKLCGLQPNLITYSTIIKGVCSSDMDTAFTVFKDLKASGVKPDEIVYNTMLDGCATAGLVSEGEKLLEDMKTVGLAPTNYTLTVLVRLYGQERYISRAFEVIETFAQKHRIKANSHVYTALIQSCLSNRDHSRAAEAFEQSVRRRVLPEQRTCSSLFRALINSGKADYAVGLLRSLPGLTKPGTVSASVITDDIINDILACLLGGSAGARALAPPLVADIRAARPTLRLDPSTDRSLALTVARQHGGSDSTAPKKSHPWSK